MNLQRTRMMPHGSYMLAFVFLVSLGISQAFAHPAGPGRPDVTVQANVAGTALVATSSSQCTGNPQRPNFPENGCARFPRNAEDSLKFSLTGAPSCGAVGNQWKLDGLQIANVNGAKPNPWPALVTNLDPMAIRDYDVNPNTGWVNYTVVGNAITIENRNLSQTGYYLWYRLRATCTDPAAGSIYLDPRMDNEGTD